MKKKALPAEGEGRIKATLTDAGLSLHDQMHALCDELGATLVHNYEGPSLDALHQMVAMNIGATFLPPP